MDRDTRRFEAIPCPVCGGGLAERSTRTVKVLGRDDDRTYTAQVLRCVDCGHEATAHGLEIVAP